jgi:ubiquitin C-terminal hydrolase
MTTAVMSPFEPFVADYHDENDEDTTMESSLVVFEPLFSSIDDEMVDNDVPDLAVEQEEPATADDGAMMAAADESENIRSSPLSFGGLNNLGNTCYMASALQMLASLDHFVPSLAEMDPPESHNNADDGESRLELRKAFLDLQQSMRGGISVSPSAFKRAMDARSSLFIGYRQQDSHEFLTNLLDLLDEDYHVKEQDVKEDEAMEEVESDTNPESSVAIEETHLDSKLPAVETGDPVEDNDSDVSSSPPLPGSPMRRMRSYAQLDNEDISQLLHGNKKSKQDNGLLCGSPKEPHCKLIGGRAVVAPSTALSSFPLSDRAGTESVAKIPLQEVAPTQQQHEEDEETPAQQADEQEPSPVDDYFATQIRARLTCDSCHYTRSHIEKFLHLSLDIGTDSGSVEEGLRTFFAPESRQIKCEKCFCETATQTTEIVKLPRALLVHFKRFIVDVSPDYSSIVYRKNQSPVHFSKSLPVSDRGVLGEFLAPDVDIPERPDGGESDDDYSMSDEREYLIRSVVNHIGSSASCGHYTSDAERLYSNGERSWTRFNDSYVSQVTEEDAMGESARRTAYMVMYELH